MSYDVKKNCIRVQGGREYLPVAQRLVWFRMEHPDWGIVTEAIEINMEKNYAIFKASIFNAEGRLMATATKHENMRGFGDFIEKCETGAIGRALAYCGYGTQFEPALDEGERLADAPVGPPSPVAGDLDAIPQEFATTVPPMQAESGVCSEPGCKGTLTPSQLVIAMGRYTRPICLACLKRMTTPPPSVVNSTNGSATYAHV